MLPKKLLMKTYSLCCVILNKIPFCAYAKKVSGGFYKFGGSLQEILSICVVFGSVAFGCF